MVTLISFLLNLVAWLFKSKGRLDAQNAALRHQLVVLQRKGRGRVHFTGSDRLFFIQPLALVSVCPQCYFDHPARDDCPLASCRLTLCPDFARDGASASEPIARATRQPRSGPPGPE